MRNQSSLVDGSEIRRSPVTCGDCKTKKDLDKFTGKIQPAMLV